MKGYETSKRFRDRLSLHEAFPAEGGDFHAWAWSNLAEAFSAARVVLEFGAGTGAIWRSARFGGRLIILADLSAAMARELKGELGADAQILCADAAAPPIADASVDLLLLHSMLHYLGAPEQSLTGAAALLRPGGVVSVLVSGRDNLAEMFALFDACGSGVDLKAGIRRFDEDRADAFFASQPPKVRKRVFTGAVVADRDEPIVRHIMSHASLAAHPDRAAIEQSFRAHVAKRVAQAPLRISKRYAHYLWAPAG